MKKTLISLAALAAISTPALADTLANSHARFTTPSNNVNRSVKSDFAGSRLFTQGVITPVNYRSQKQFMTSKNSIEVYKSPNQGAADKP